MRAIEELINPTGSAWPKLDSELAACPSAEVLPVDPAAGRRCLHAIQVTTRSRIGAMALHAGGVVLDHGWLRVYGGGCPERGLVSLRLDQGMMIYPFLCTEQAQADLAAASREAAPIEQVLACQAGAIDRRICFDN
ncbi:DUF2625 family protein [Allorhizocola rhizosphaerae]|uniref:DUF2625 family protein n=1 Tax=Allorhizocola rhizosphaerae TaxID=1872709 RepID=UPI000E3DD36B|nr:DUF2625 family protein [Allorhizocola rhizosphaerae]